MEWLDAASASDSVLLKKTGNERWRPGRTRALGAYASCRWIRHGLQASRRSWQSAACIPHSSSSIAVSLARTHTLRPPSHSRRTQRMRRYAAPNVYYMYIRNAATGVVDESNNPPPRASKRACAACFLSPSFASCGAG
jgi:hypothetical protein